MAAIDRDVQELLTVLAENGLAELAAEAARRLTGETDLGDDPQGQDLEDGELHRIHQLDRVDDLVMSRVNQQLLMGKGLRATAGEFGIKNVIVEPDVDTERLAAVPSFLRSDILTAPGREEALQRLAKSWAAAAGALRKTWESELGDR